jgi:hypothetical protein
VIARSVPEILTAGELKRQATSMCKDLDNTLSIYVDF